MVNCPICGKNFKTRASFSSHLTRIHEEIETVVDKEKLLIDTLYGKTIVDNTILDYMNELYCIHSLPIDISKYLMLSGLKRTSKQERATNRYKQKYTNSIFEKYGVNNISQSPEIQRKKEKTFAKTHGSYENYLNNCVLSMNAGYSNYVGTEKHKLTAEKQQNTCLLKYGNVNFGAGDLAKQKSKQSRKQTIDSWDYEERLSRTENARTAVTSRGGYSSKPEKRVRKSLIELDIESEYNIMKWKYSWDLILLNYNIIIEVQGDMWHAHPSLYKETDFIMGKLLVKDIWNKDAKKRLVAENNGYKVVEIWEHEIVKSSDDDLNILLKNKLIEVGYEFYL